MEAHVHVVFPQDPIADDGRHGRGAPVKAAEYVDGPGGVRARGRVSLPSGAAQTSAADAMMIKCDDIVRERDIASVCAIEFVQTGLFCACLAGRLDKYDALSVFFGLR